MEPLIVPHLNADVYRNMTAADRPPIRDRHLQFLLIANENSAVLGGSYMTDRYWDGTVWYYTNLSDFDSEKAFLAARTESGVCCAGFLEEDKFVVGEDSGVLQVFGVAETTDTHSKELQCLGFVCQHDDSLTSVSVFSDKSRIVTGGMDCCIKVWDTEELIATNSFSYAHINCVTSVATLPQNLHAFVSTSLDCEALMWDVRQPKPAHRLFKSSCGLRTAACSTVKDHVVALGDAYGSLILFDIRNTHYDILSETVGFPRPMHKLLFNPDSRRSEQIAGCCDGTLIKVFDTCKELSVVYQDNRHKDFVCGLAWHENQLLSCSWDSSVLRHALEPSNP